MPHPGHYRRWSYLSTLVAVGLHVSRLDGTALRYNQANPWLPDQLICRQGLAAEVPDALCC
jgi:3'(2'), 5'-bisphosphate nucleotidase